jgi:PPOX class probable F420-dependent enzyme
MPLFDTSTPFGERAARRLAEDRIAWLTTVDRAGTPQPVPVWFLYEDGEVLLYSQPGQAKLRNIARNPRVALHLDGDGQGGDVVVLTGDAREAPEQPPAHEVEAYARKYAWGFDRIGVSPEQFSAMYSQPVRISVTRVRGH